MSGLKERYITLQFSQGLDTETDEKTVPVGKLTTLQNAVFDRRVTLVKRHGTVPLDTRINGIPYRGIAGAQGLATRLDGSDLVMLTTDDLILSRESSGGWSQRGPWVHMALDLTSLPARPNESWDPSYATVGNKAVCVWEDARGGVFGQVLSVERQGALSRDFRIGGSQSRRPQVVPVGQEFVVFYTSGSNLYSAPLDVIDPGNPSVGQNLLLSTLSGSGIGPWTYDVAPFDDTVCVLTANAGQSMRLAFVKGSGFLATSGSYPFRPSPIISSSITPYAGPSCAVSPDTQLVAYVAQNPSSTAISGALYRSADFSILSTFVVDASPNGSSTNPVQRMSAQFVSCSFGYDLEVVTEVSNAGGSPPSLVRRSHVHVDPTGSVLVQSSGTLVRQSNLASRPFTMGTSNFVWVTHVSPEQTTNFMVRTSDGLICAASNPELAQANVSGVLPNVNVVGTEADLPVCVRTLLQLPGTAGTTYGGRQLALSSAEFRPSYSWRPVDADGVLYMPGGWAGKYDGSYVTELGYRLAVEGLTVTPGSGALGGRPDVVGNLQGIVNFNYSGSVFGNVPSLIGTNGTASYAYAVIPEYTDARGNRELGTYSAQVNVSISGGYNAGGVLGLTSCNSASLMWPSIAHTMRDGTNAPNIRFAVYRSGPNGTVLQRIDNPASPILNNTGSDNITWVDTFSEPIRAAGEEIYSAVEGPNVLPNSPSSLAIAGDRLYMAGIEGSPYDLEASKLRLGGTFAFTPGDGTSVDAAGGPVTRLAAEDGNVIVFKRNRVFGTPAQGPTNSNTDTTPFPQVSSIVSDTGVPNYGTVVEVAGETVQGLIYWSGLRGARLMDRSLTVSNVGYPVKEFDGFTVVGGISPRGSEDARLYTADGTTLSLNTRFNQWSTFPDQSAVAAAVWNDTPVWASADGRCWVETTGSYLDGSTPYPMVIETGWIPLADSVQGLGQVWEGWLIFSYYSPFTLRLEVAYDYVDSYTQTIEWAVPDVLGVSPYGGPPGYGSGSYGGSGRPPQVRFRPNRPRCQAIRFRISTRNGTGQDASFTEIKLRCGVESRRPYIGGGRVG